MLYCYYNVLVFNVLLLAKYMFQCKYFPLFSRNYRMAFCKRITGASKTQKGHYILGKRHSMPRVRLGCMA